MNAAFITFEGIDGCGKSTQMRMLASELRLRGNEVISTHEPGGTPLGQRLRAALLDTEEQVDPLAELLLFAADRAQHVRAMLRPALESGRMVLSDRYADATVAYQQLFNAKNILDSVSTWMCEMLGVTESSIYTLSKDSHGAVIIRPPLESDLTGRFFCL